jgi:hypothetical protein
MQPFRLLACRQSYYLTILRTIGAAAAAAAAAAKNQFIITTLFNMGLFFVKLHLPSSLQQENKNKLLLNQPRDE